MDVSTLHTLNEDLAAFLSEVTLGDLRRQTQHTSGDVGDLYLHLIDQNIDVATAITGRATPRGKWHDPADRSSFDSSADIYGGCGLETGYRQTARLMESAFAAAVDGGNLYQPNGFPNAVDLTALYETQVANTVVHTWDIAQALGLPYRPSPDVARQVLRTNVLGMPQADDIDAFECVLQLSGRCLPAVVIHEGVQPMTTRAAQPTA